MSQERLPNPSITPLSLETQQEIKSKFLGFSDALVTVGDIGHLLPPNCSRFVKKYQDFRFREDDVLIMTFPRSGTTWTQELVWCMTHSLDFDTATSTPLNHRSPFFEFDSLAPSHHSLAETMVTNFAKQDPGEDPRQVGIVLKAAESMRGPRIFKSHLPFSLLPPRLLDTCKVVYVARNPRDTCVSYHHHQRLVKTAEYVGSLEEFVDFWCRDLVLQAPYWGQLREAWARRDHPNLLWLYYEDMKEDLPRELKRLDYFLGTALTEEQLRQLARHGSFSGMKHRPATNPSLDPASAVRFTAGEAEFVRKGTVGDWVNYFTPELETKFKLWEASGGEVARQVPFRYHLDPPSEIQQA